jgi:hypothetical protein
MALDDRRVLIALVATTFVGLLPGAKAQLPLAVLPKFAGETATTEDFRDAVEGLASLKGDGLSIAIRCCVSLFWSVARRSSDPLARDYREALGQLCFLIKRAIHEGCSLSTGGVLTTSAIEGVHDDCVRTDDSAPVLMSLSKQRVKGPLLELFTLYLHLLEHECGIAEWWNDEEGGWSFLGRAASWNEVEVCSLLLARGARSFRPEKAPVFSPVANAFNVGHEEVFRIFVEAGLDPTARFQVSVERELLAGPEQIPFVNWCYHYSALLHRRPATEELRAGRRQMIQMLFDLRPDVSSLRRIHRPKGGPLFEFTLLEEAIAVNDPLLAKLALDNGIKVLFSDEPSGLRQGAIRPATFSLIRDALADKVLLYLAEHEALLDASKYSEKRRYEMVTWCCACAVLSIAPPPESVRCTKEKASNFVDAYLRAGNKAMLDESGNNILVAGLFGREDATEADILAVLQRFYEAGADLKTPWSDPILRDWTLLHCAAHSGFRDIIDFAITVVGVPIESIAHGKEAHQLDRKITPLGAALDAHNVDAAIHLVKRHGAKACVLGLDGDDQAIGRLVAVKEVPEARIVLLVKEMLRSQPDLLDLKYHAPALGGEQGYPGVLGGFMMWRWHGVVETLLNPSNLHVREAVDCVTVAGQAVGSAVQCASLYQDWKMVAILVRAGAKVTTNNKGPLPFGLVLKPEMGFLPSCLDMVRRFCKDRAVRMLVEAKAEKENTEGKKGDAAASTGVAGSTLPSETFEDPSFKPVLTEKEEKKKAKKRAAKKKAKEKKRAAAKEGNAGAGKVESDNDSDSSGTDEEEKGMDEEERMLARAPTFDLEKEKAARKARAEAAKATETGEKG